MNDMEEDKIQQPVTEDDGLDSWNEIPHPQDELPVEVVTMYVVRDYRRMYNAFERYKKLAAMNIKQIEGRALAIASRRKAETQELTDLRLRLEDRERKINEMYDWLQQKDSMISSLCGHCTRQRDQLAAQNRNITAQRQQIQSLLKHYDDGDRRFEALADAEDAWNPDRWKQAMVEMYDLRQNATELYDIVDTLPVGEDVRSVLKASVGIIRGKTRRCYNATARVANVLIRNEFGVEIVPENDGEKDLTSD